MDTARGSARLRWHGHRSASVLGATVRGDRERTAAE